MSNPPIGHIYRTLLGRSAFAFEVMLRRHDRSFLLSTEHIEKLCHQRDAIAKQSNLYYLLSVACAYLLINVTGPQTINITSPFVHIDNITLSPELIIIVCAFFYLKFIQSFFNVVILSNCLTAISNELGYEDAEFVIAGWSSQNIWTAMIRFRNFGYASGLIHKILILALALILFLLLTIQVSFINFAAYHALLSFFENGPISIFVGSLSFSSIFMATILGTFALTVPMKFPWIALPDAEVGEDVDVGE